MQYSIIAYLSYFKSPVDHLRLLHMLWNSPEVSWILDLLCLGGHHPTLSLHVLLTDFSLPWITGLLIPAYTALQACQAVSNTAQVPVQGACFHSNYTFHNLLVKHFEDMTLSVANTKRYCWTGLTWAIKQQFHKKGSRHKGRIKSYMPTLYPNLQAVDYLDWHWK